LSAQFKNFDFSALLQGVGKQDVFLDGALIEGPTWENFFGTYLLDYCDFITPADRRKIFRDNTLGLFAERAAAKAAAGARR